MLAHLRAIGHRSVSGKDYAARLQSGEQPQYHGTVLKLRHQVQRFLIDNLRQGVSEAQFRQLFRGEVWPFVERYAPSLIPVLERRNGEIRCTQAVQSDQAVQAALFDPVLKRRLYLNHIAQPKGWPVEKMTPEAMSQQTDWNWLHFLAIELTKGNTYPPITKDQQVTEKDVFEAWSGYAKAIKKGTVSPVAGIYCHVPFCATKCKFCYCYSVQIQEKARMTAYVRAVQRQIQDIASHTRSIRFQTLYFGGGTPSLLPPQLLDELLETIHDHFTFEDGFQFNFEGTPQTLGIDGRIAILARHGVSRLTIGIQSLEKHLLEHMDRAQQSRVRVGEVVAEAREHGIPTINVDVMAGLPGQSLSDFQRTFDEVLSWRPEVIHPYPYQNTAETRFHAEGFRIEAEGMQQRSEMMEYAYRRLREEQYQEVPNESWCLGIEHRNQQDVDKIKSSCSVLPLGYVARGHVFGALTYGTVATEIHQFMDDPSHREIYYGSQNTPRDEQVRYIISNLRSGFSRIDFEATFGVDCLDQFWWPLSILQKLGKVNVTALHVESRMTNSLDSVLYSKLFFAPEYHEWLRAHFADRYQPSVDYEAALLAHYEARF